MPGGEISVQCQESVPTATSPPGMSPALLAKPLQHAGCRADRVVSVFSLTSSWYTNHIYNSFATQFKDEPKYTDGHAQVIQRENAEAAGSFWGYLEAYAQV